ncbi:hypothetical protein A3841_01410 [Pontibacter flavimaris]|uniref:Methyltransferase FkbM domain-containing protein n=2 Tax=Pontibacter flavimaris TaxID=1797110 RepID=A0A1Q5PBQ6_9BACT|nr:hypothetical protein A3841_01410 [Pontibacter flavimaris]
MVSEDLRWKIWTYRIRNTELGRLRSEFLNYYGELSPEKLNSELQDVVGFVKKHGVVTFPYPYIYNYSPEQVKLYRDEKLDLPYVQHQGKRLYYKRTWDEIAIKENYNFLSIEQDPASPHLYLTAAFNVEEGDIVVDVGAAEGNFSLGIVEKVSKLYIFETDSEWIEALQATFAPWKEKVHILNKYVSDVVGENNITLDEFLKDYPQVDFVKIDAEGAEAKILEGAEMTLQKHKALKVAICTYHKQQDAVELAHMLRKHGFNIEYSDGYMFFLEDKQTPPYVRKGLIRARK